MSSARSRLLLLTTPFAGAVSLRANIVLFVHDDQNHWDYGVYGSPHNATPAADALAAEGIAFTRAYATSAMCAPSRASLLTGLYPMRHGAFANHYSVRSDAPSLTTWLQPLGYRSYLVGKMHGMGASFHFDGTALSEGELNSAFRARQPTANAQHHVGVGVRTHHAARASRNPAPTRPAPTRLAADRLYAHWLSTHRCRHWMQ
jgi:arylsulfatase A-like enzyme